MSFSKSFTVERSRINHEAHTSNSPVFVGAISNGTAVAGGKSTQGQLHYYRIYDDGFLTSMSGEAQYSIEIIGLNGIDPAVIAEQERVAAALKAKLEKKLKKLEKKLKKATGAKAEKFKKKIKRLERLLKKA